MLAYRERPDDIEPAEHYEFEHHAKGCKCDPCSGAYEETEVETWAVGSVEAATDGDAALAVGRAISPVRGAGR